MRSRRAAGLRSARPSATESRLITCSGNFPMAKHYIYRVDHDVGFAPHVEGRICTLCGCKSTSVERWATKGSFVVGLGGCGTGQPDAVIYAMRVEATPPLAEFIKRYPRRSRYLLNLGISLDAPVLL